MSREYLIDVVRDGDELLRVWEECQRVPPNVAPTIERLEDGKFGFLAARLGHTAVGYEMISWIGQNPNETEFVNVVKESFPDEQANIPTLYDMYVHKDYRRQGAGRALLQGAEANVVENVNTPNILVLSVREDNLAAQKLYESEGYEALSRDGQTIFTNIAAVRDKHGEWQPQKVQSLFMVKDLESIKVRYISQNGQPHKPTI